MVCWTPSHFSPMNYINHWHRTREAHAISCPRKVAKTGLKFAIVWASIFKSAILDKVGTWYSLKGKFPANLIFLTTQDCPKKAQELVCRWSVLPCQQQDPRLRWHCMALPKIFAQTHPQIRYLWTNLPSKLPEIRYPRTMIGRIWGPQIPWWVSLRYESKLILG